MMKALRFLILLASGICFGQQSLALQDAYDLARENYPLIKRTSLIEKTRDYNLENISKGWLPQINIIGQASYQNEVTKIPITLPNLTIDPPSKDQYKVYADVQQNIYDGGIIANQKKIANLNSSTELQKNEVELAKLKERINQLYFGVLQTDEQTAQTELTEKDIQNALQKAEAQLKNGVIYRSNVDVLKAQLIGLQQKKIELQTARKNLIAMLSAFINKPLAQNTALEKPEKLLIAEENKRPELKLFDLQKETLSQQKKMVLSKNLPKLGAFFQGGYGKPGFNMLKNEFSPLLIGGVRLNIPISGFYTYKNDLAIIDNQMNDVEIQRENFLFNQKFQTIQNNNELEKIQNLIDTDNQLIALRESIMSATLAQLQNGVITTSDYLREVNELDRARTQKILHETQYLLTQYNQKAQLNN